MEFNTSESTPEEDVAVLCFDGERYFDAWYKSGSWHDDHGEIMDGYVKAWAYKLNVCDMSKEEAIKAAAGLLDRIQTGNLGQPSTNAINDVKTILAAVGHWEALQERDNLQQEIISPAAFERVLAWLQDPQRKSAAQSFTASMERQIAYLLEQSILPAMRQKEIQAERYRQGYNRYEKLRRLNPREFTELWKTHLSSTKTFDEMVDDLR